MPSSNPITKPLLRALNGEVQEQVPLWLMRQAGRYLPEYRRVRRQAATFLDLCYTPELAVEVSLQPLRRFGMDGAIVFSDILVVADALGLRVDFHQGRGPVVERLRDPGDLGRLKPAGLHERLAPVYDAVGLLAEKMPEGAALIGFAGAPWTLASYMVEGGTSVDLARTKLWAYSDPESFQRLVKILVEATAEFVIRQVRSGAEVIQLFDSWAGVLPEVHFVRWCVEPTADLVRRIKKACPDVAVIGFVRGAGLMSEEFVIRTGVDAVGLDSVVPLSWAAATLQRRCPVQGNLDPLVLVAGGEALRADVRRILSALGQGPFIFNLGHGVLPTTPPEHVALLVELVRGWRR